MTIRRAGSKAVEAKAVFHDQAVMEHAVHELVSRGVSTTEIRVSKAAADEHQVHKAPERGRAMLIGALVGAAVGGTLALMALVPFLDTIAPFYVVLRVLGGAGAGLVVGGLVSLILGGPRPANRPVMRTAYGDFLVRVKTPNEATAEEIRDVLVREGGDPLPA